MLASNLCLKCAKHCIIHLWLSINYVLKVTIPFLVSDCLSDAAEICHGNMTDGLLIEWLYAIIYKLRSVKSKSKCPTGIFYNTIHFFFKV